MSTRIGVCGYCHKTEFTSWYSQSAPRNRYGVIDRDFLDSQPVAYCSEEHRDAADAERAQVLTEAADAIDAKVAATPRERGTSGAHRRGMAAAADLVRQLIEEKDTAPAATPTPLREAHPGELFMYRGLVGVLRVVAQHGDMAEVQRLLTEHAADEQAAYAETPTADAPDFYQPGTTYSDPDPAQYDWRFRCDTVTTRPDNGERTALGWRHFRGEWEPYAYGEDDWDINQTCGLTTTEARRG